MLGMKNVHSLWEKAIKEVFGDQLDMKISDIKGLTPEDSKKDKTLMEYIDPPKWMGKTGQDGALEITKKGKVGQLEPDFVAIEKYENSEQKYMVILDAKYYVPDFSKDGKTITGQPSQLVCRRMVSSIPGLKMTDLRTMICMRAAQPLMKTSGSPI